MRRRMLIRKMQKKGIIREDMKGILERKMRRRMLIRRMQKRE